MKKLVSVRNGMIVVLCITIICLGIGFIILSIELDKEKKTDKVYDVSFVEVSKISSVSGGSVEPVGNISIEDDGKLLNMDFIMKKCKLAALNLVSACLKCYNYSVCESAQIKCGNNEVYHGGKESSQIQKKTESSSNYICDSSCIYCVLYFDICL